MAKPDQAAVLGAPDAADYARCPVEPDVRDLLEGVLRYARSAAMEDGTAPPYAIERVRGFVVGTMETLRGLDHLETDEWLEWAPMILSETFARPTESDLADPFYAPPARISEDEARRYEQLLLERVRFELAGAGDQGRLVATVELSGSRPGTRLVLHYRDTHKEQNLTWSFRLWESGYPDADAPWTGTLASPAELANSILTDWSSDYWARGEVASA